ncbi:hypothetical protein AJ79_08622 [Helicocarpus griseus UAMH5409]|uniref:Uncharacterized protein n=1 Tax=Helicocarpus griseus UAMH5409 TaxID=1447875 RepID=A0A2B7WRW0_9EURO|nr:hypothetical protein AJ79_08622 [Helicocarpus griseus UAMH5409]
MADSPYFVNPPPDMDLTESRTKVNNGIAIALFVLAVIAVVLRTIARLRFQRVTLAADDLSYLLGVGNLACCMAGGNYGLGKHIGSLGPYEMEKISVVRKV